MKQIFLSICIFLSLNLHSQEKISPPQGLRPCCAFGHHLQSEIGTIPIPFFEVENIVNTENLGSHLYNDGSELAVKRLFNLSEEKNGLIFTELGGFIDTAHVRDTADYTFYLFQQIPHLLGSGEKLDLGQELRQRSIYFPIRKNNLTPHQRQQLSLELAAILAFKIAQWHEIAQYFGYQSVRGISEEISAFSPEDLYSNMLGAILAKNILEKNPTLSLQQFNHQFSIEFSKALIDLKAKSKQETQNEMQQREGDWWDKTKRVPNKWLIKKRDYKLALTLSPNGIDKGKTLTLSPILNNGENYINWANLLFIGEDHEKSFQNLPEELKNKKIFLPKNFFEIAKIAYQLDKKNQQCETQVE